MLLDIKQQCVSAELERDVAGAEGAEGEGGQREEDEAAQLQNKEDELPPTAKQEQSY